MVMDPNSKVQFNLIWIFLKVLCNDFSSKEAQLIADLLGFFEKHHFQEITAVGRLLLWVIFVKFWATFYSKTWSHCNRLNFSVSFT